MDDGMVWLLPPLVAGVAIGFVLRRWAALLLAVVIPPVLIIGGEIPFLPRGEASDRDAEWAWALILLGPPALLGLVVGVGAGRWRSARSVQARQHPSCG